MNDQMIEALKNQMEHVAASMKVDRSGWSDDQWIEDARRLMGDIEGSVLDLLNGHVTAMLRRLGALTEEDNEREPKQVTELPDPSECPYCAECRSLGMIGCLGHYPEENTDE